MAIVAQRPHELVQRQQASLAAGAGGQAGSVHERGMAHRVDPLQQTPQLHYELGPSQRQPPLQRMQAGQRLEVTLPRPAEPEVGASRGGGVALVDDQ